MSRTVELLAPAKDSPTARTAILCGADAVYLGAPRNEELSEAERMIHQFYEAGVDGLIVQDVGLLELDLPPLPLIAGTQMHNATVEKVQFMEQVGFSRMILARELTLDQIRRIRSQTQVELECFIHGALCVGVSGQCYMSYALGGRSGNRGQCAQPCRRLYSLRDQAGKEIVKDGDQELHNADGLCFFDRRKNLDGTVVNRVEGRRVYPQKMHGIRVGQNIYRNFDHEFSRRLAGQPAERKVGLTMSLQEAPDGLLLSGVDLSGQVVMATLRKELGLCSGPGAKSPAEPMILEDQDDRRYPLRFGCGPCGMEIFT